MIGEPHPNHPEFSGEPDTIPATPTTKRNIQAAIKAKAAGGFEMVPGENSSTQAYTFPSQPERGNFGVTLCGQEGWDGRPDLVGHVNHCIPGRTGSLIVDYDITRRPDDPTDPYGMEVTSRLMSDTIFDTTPSELMAIIDESIKATKIERAAGLTGVSEKQAQGLLALLNDPNAVQSPPLR